MSKKHRLPKSPRAANSGPQQVTSMIESILGPDEADLNREIETICQLAARGESRVIGFDKLVLFSTTTRDAWMLDWEDQFATCLMMQGQPQPYEVGETDRQFAIKWEGRYLIDGSLFSYLEGTPPEQAGVFQSYPTRNIRDTIKRLQRGI